MRAGRELELSTKDFFKRSDLYQARFIGVEIEFPPGLDDVFGVTNNKQHAHNLRDVTDNEYYDGNRQLTNSTEIIDYLKKEGESDTAILYEVAMKLTKLVANVKNELKNISLQKTDINRTGDITVDDKVSVIVGSTNSKRDKTHPGESSSQTPDYAKVKDVLVNKYGITEDEASATKNKMEELKSRVTIKYRSIDSGGFFSVDNVQGVTILVINTEHELYRKYLCTMDEYHQLVFKVLLGAWARLEDEVTIRGYRRQLERARTDWSMIIEDMLDEIDNESNDTDM